MTIKELIRMVQDELIMAQEERIKQNVGKLFETSELEIELNTVLLEEDNGNFKLSVLPFKADVSNDYQEQYVQKIKLKFKVANRNDDRFLPDSGCRVDGYFPEYYEF